MKIARYSDKIYYQCNVLLNVIRLRDTMQTDHTVAIVMGERLLPVLQLFTPSCLHGLNITTLCMYLFFYVICHNEYPIKQ